MECQILAEISEYKSGIGENARIVPRHLKRPPREIDAAHVFGLFGPALSNELHLTHRRQGQRRTTVPIDCYRLLEQFESFEKSLSCYWIEVASARR
jgi:hypothetical protein